MNATVENRVENQFEVRLITGEATFDTDKSVLDDIIGQEEVHKILNFFIDSHSEITPFPTLLLPGSHGLGKTYTARKIAGALGRELIEINCTSISDVKTLIEEVFFGQVAGEKPKTILFDEAHRLSGEVTNTLLTILSPNEDNRTLYNYKGWQIVYDFTKINTIFATTDAYKIFSPLVDRCEEVYFHLYPNDELLRILKFYLPNITIKCAKKNLGYACRGRARDTFRLSQHILRYCLMNKTKVLDKKAWESIKATFSIHDLGLKTQEVELLKLLKHHAPISCRNLAMRMGVRENNVEGELEVRPRELGLIDSTSRGRCLSPEGMKYVEGID